MAWQAWGQVKLNLWHYTPSNKGMGNHGNIAVGVLPAALTRLSALLIEPCDHLDLAKYRYLQNIKYFY